MGERYSSRMARAWAEAEAWNASHPVGTKVRVSTDEVKSYETVTRSEASAMVSGKVVVSLANGPVWVANMEQISAI